MKVVHTTEKEAPELADVREKMSDAIEEALRVIFEGEEPHYALIAIPKKLPEDGGLRVMLASNVPRHKVPEYLEYSSELLELEKQITMAQAMHESETETTQ